MIKKFQDFMNEGKKSEIPSMDKLKTMFDKINKDSKRKVAFSDWEYYAQQIYNIYFDEDYETKAEETKAFKKAEILAKKLSKM